MQFLLVTATSFNIFQLLSN